MCLFLPEAGVHCAELQNDGELCVSFVSICKSGPMTQELNIVKCPRFRGMVLSSLSPNKYDKKAYRVQPLFFS